MSLRKIAYVTPLYFDEKSCLGGGERYPLNLATGVVHASGGTCSVELISYGDSSSRQTLRPGITLRVLRADNRPGERLDACSWELPAAIEDADLVHIHMAYTRSNEMALVLAKQFNKPIVVTDHGGVTSSIGRTLNSLDMVDRIVAYSDFGASLYTSKTPIEIIKGGVDASTFVPAVSQPQRDRVLYVGRLVPHKGVEHLIEAMPPGLPLTVCGRPYHNPYYDRLQQFARGKQVEFVTDADDLKIRDLYHRSWVNVLPSVYRDCYGGIHVQPELMGFTLLEAMACRTPVICSRVGAMPEFVRHGETGFIYDSQAELTELLQRLASDPNLVERMGRRACQVVEQEYDLKVAGRKLLNVYQSISARYAEAAA